VILEVLVDREGVPQQIQVMRSLLEAAAVDAVRQWRWMPYRVNDKGIAFWVTVTVTFRLTDAD
jgi:TonB family protein